MKAKYIQPLMAVTAVNIKTVICEFSNIASDPDTGIDYGGDGEGGEGDTKRRNDDAWNIFGE